MLRLSGGQVESLWDEVLPIGVRELPEDLAALDVLLRDRALLAPIVAFWECEAAAGRASVGFGRPTIAIETYVRLMVVKHRTGWGYETLVREVSDSLHLRRFCLVALGEDVPEESTVQKAHAPFGWRGGRRVDAVGDREGQAGDAVSGAGGADRLDGRRGGRALSDRLGVDVGRGAGAGPGVAARDLEGRRGCRACAWIGRGRWGGGCG